MRALLSVLCAVVFGTGCVGHKASGARRSTESAPTRALRLANAYIERLAVPPSESERDEIRLQFTHEFFLGFTGPEDSLIGSGAPQAGFRAGQKFRHTASASQVRHTMEEFGYAYTEAEGTWGTGFEVSCFRPRSMPDESWWLSGFGDTKYAMPKRRDASSGPVYFRVTGYLSPKGKCGHLGGYDRQFYATRVVHIKGG
jgi:hypothetical protein